MRVKKAGGKVFGADLTAAERKAMNLEIQRQLAEYDRKHANELDIWLCTYKLKEIGVDIESWNKDGEVK